MASSIPCFPRTQAAPAGLYELCEALVRLAPPAHERPREGAWHPSTEGLRARQGLPRGRRYTLCNGTTATSRERPRDTCGAASRTACTGRRGRVRGEGRGRGGSG